MKIGVPKEIKIHEYRVGLVPAGVRELVDAGHQVLVQSGAGGGIGFDDSPYKAAGASIAPRAGDVFSAADLIVKVKEPQLGECKQLRCGQTLFTYLHLAADREQAEALKASGATAIAYETVTAPDGSLPLLTPMSEVAGPALEALFVVEQDAAVGGGHEQVGRAGAHAVLGRAGSAHLRVDGDVRAFPDPELHARHPPLERHVGVAHRCRSLIGKPVVLSSRPAPDAAAGHH